MTSYINRPSAFANMNNKPRYVPPAETGGYLAWKNKKMEPEKKEVNIASFSEFPDLISEESKKTTTAFTGMSLANKLKEVIAAEEEAAILKRLKKGDTPEMILRESCTILPLKNYCHPSAVKEFKAPEWVTDTSNPLIIPSFRHKSLETLAIERRYKRYGIYNHEYLFESSPPSTYEDDRYSVPSLPDDMMSISSEEEMVEQVEAN